MEWNQVKILSPNVRKNRTVRSHSVRKLPIKPKKFQKKEQIREEKKGGKRKKIPKKENILNLKKRVPREHFSILKHCAMSHFCCLS